MAKVGATLRPDSLDLGTQILDSAFCHVGRRSGYAQGTYATAGHIYDWRGDAPDAMLEFLVIDCETPLAYLANLARECFHSDASIRRFWLQFGCREIRFDLLVRQARQDRFAGTCAIKGSSMSHLGKHADAPGADDLFDVHDRVVVPDDEVAGFATYFGELSQERAHDMAQPEPGVSPGGLSHLKHLQAGTIAPGLNILFDIASNHKGLKQAMECPRRKVYLLLKLCERDILICERKGFQHIDCARNRLNQDPTRQPE